MNHAGWCKLVDLRAQVVAMDSRGDSRGRLIAWLPLLLVFGGFSLSGLPSLTPALNALLVGLYLTYAALITSLHILPQLSIAME